MKGLLAMSISQNAANSKFPHNPEGFPAVLKDGRFWVACNAQKAPRLASANHAQAASSTDPNTWVSYDKAREAYESPGFTRLGLVGIGRVLTPPYMGVDIDDCIDPQTGELDPWASEIVKRLDSYAEISPSGTGVKIWIKAELDYARIRKGTDRDIEIYPAGGRYFTVTGQALGDVQIFERQAELDMLIAEEFPEVERERPEYTGNGFKGEFDLTSWLEFHHVGIRAYRPDDRGGVYSIECPWEDEHSTIDLGTKVGRAAEDGGTWFKCHHAHCADRGYPEFKEEIYKRIKRVGFKSPTDSSHRANRKTVGGESRIGMGNGDATDSSDSFFRVLDEKLKFPVESMPAKARAFIREAGKAIDCAEELVGLPVLATLSGALGHARELQVKRDYEQTSSIYAVGVANSGSGKTPAATAAEKPLKKIQSAHGKTYKVEKTTYEDEMRKHKVAAKQAAKDGNPEPRPPTKPTYQRTWVSDATIEALAGVLEQNPYGVAIFQDELTGWIASFDQYKSGGKGNTRQQFIDMWGSNTIPIDRKGEEEAIILERPYITIYGTIQPSVVHEMGADRHDGFINRFLLAYPPEHDALENTHEISSKAEMSYEDLVKSLYGMRSDVADGEKWVDTVRFGEGARDLFVEKSNELAEHASDPGNPPALRETYPKLRAYLARLSLLLSACREIEEGKKFPVAQVTTIDVRHAFELLEYFEGSARKFYHRLYSSDRTAKNCFELTSLLRQNGGYREGTAKEFSEWLPSAPNSPEATSKLLRKIVDAEERLSLDEGHRGHERVMKISLLGKTVGTVGDGSDADTHRENPTDSSTEAPTPTVGSDSEEPGEGDMISLDDAEALDAISGWDGFPVSASDAAESIGMVGTYGVGALTQRLEKLHQRGLVVFREGGWIPVEEDPQGGYEDE